MTIKELRETRANVYEQMKALNDKIMGEKRSYTAEEQQQWDRMNAQYDELSASIKRGERLEDIEKRHKEAMNSGVGRHDTNKISDRDEITAETRSLAFAGWLRSQLGKNPTEQETEACERVGLKPWNQQLPMRLWDTRDHNQLKAAYRSSTNPAEVTRALSGVAGPSGGYTIAPETLMRSIEIALLQFDSMVRVSEVIRTNTGEPIEWPTVNQTSIKGRIVGENTTADTDKTVPFGKTRWGAYKYTSDAILVPYELLEDSVFNLPEMIGMLLGERIARIGQDHFTTGDGREKPVGIVTAAPVGVTAASTTAFTADEIFDLQHSVDPAYRAQGASFMMHDLVARYVRKLKDGDGQYLWRSGIEMGKPDMLLGSPVETNQSMSSTFTTGQDVMIFGLLNKYKIRQVNEMRFYRLVERYRDNDQDGFVCFFRQDGNLLDAGTNPVKKLRLG